MHRPQWRILGEAHEVILLPWGEPPIRQGVRLREQAALRALERVLRGVAAWSVPARTLGEAARYLRARHRYHGDTDIAVVREALTRGELTLWKAPLHLTPSPLGEVDDDPLASAPATAPDRSRTWIEIELTDMEGNPMRGERYWIKLTDGSIREGALNEQGRAFFGDLDPGQCEIRWPDRDGEATVLTPPMLSAPPPREKTWIEIELTDMEGNPRPGEAYWIKTTDGVVHEGQLDRNGRARFDSLDPGICEVRWPDLDDDAHIAGLDATVGHPESHDNDAQAQTLIDAARDGVPFCEECERARRRMAAGHAAAV